MSNIPKSVLAFLVALVFAAAVVWYVTHEPVPPPAPEVPEVPATPEPTATTSTSSVIGSSVEGRAIEAYTFGSGDTKLLFVGGVHGGYEWNSVLLAYRFIDHFTQNPMLIPEGITVSIIPNLNPDGTYMVTGKDGRFAAADVILSAELLASARFNANGVDLNRNFECKWAPESSWRGATVSAGTAAFSEPEAVALREYVNAFAPEAVVFWHSQANTVYGSECEEGILPETLTIMNTYAESAGYGAQAVFDAYPITGDAEGWLASVGIPAITVEFATHADMDWDKNQRGVTALFNYYQTREAR